MRGARPTTIWIASAAIVLLALVAVLRRAPSAPPATSLAAPGTSPSSARPSDGASPEVVVGGGKPAAAVAAEAEPPTLPRKFERRFMFDCNGDRIFVRIGDGEASLLPPGSLTGYYIPLARAGSVWRGRYANEDILFRHDGDVGAFELGEDKFADCVAYRDAASVGEAAGGGVLVQAFGHSPEWTFEIRPQDFTLTTAAGARHVVPFREPIDSGAKITFRSVLGTQEMVAVIDRIPCLDAPSGETLAYAVTVTFDNEWYYGCGRFITYR